MTAHEVHSIDETLELGRRLARRLQEGDVLALAGDLGAGKTHLVKGIADGLGATETVTSPTFTLVHEYHTGRLPVYHFDLYRLDQPHDLVAIGWDDYLDSHGVVLVEWADKFPDLMPDHTQWWRFEILDSHSRRLTVSGS